MAILDDADDLNEESANAFLKTLEEPPPGAVLILIGTSAEVQLQTIVSRCQVVRFDPLPADDVAALLLEQGVARDAEPTPPDSRPWATAACAAPSTWPTPALERFRRALIDELAADHGFDPPALAHRVLDHVKQAGKESVDQRRRASLLVGELSRFFRGVLWQTAGLEPPCPDTADRRAAEALAARLEPEDVLVLADRCLEADYHIQRRLAVNLILESLAHDLGKLLNVQGLRVAERGRLPLRSPGWADLAPAGARRGRSYWPRSPPGPRNPWTASGSTVRVSIRLDPTRIVSAQTDPGPPSIEVERGQHVVVQTLDVDRKVVLPHF